jgi:hypothetical protein
VFFTTVSIDISILKKLFKEIVTYDKENKNKYADRYKLLDFGEDDLARRASSPIIAKIDYRGFTKCSRPS